ncbi:ectoine synthase [Lentibacter algarum]|uniref:ectoine synthase n=1 Tax=Lentibacter algarum TaxID=576131 RepID=UPI003BB216EC
MIVKHLKDILGTKAHATGEGWESRRILLAADGLGYSLHDTLVREGAELELEYKNHVETNYCIAGEGEVEEVSTGRVWPLAAGSVYVLNAHQRHILRALKGDLRLVCVFTPALTGEEVHDESGSYAAEA